MKLKTYIQKNILGFKPELHWKMILLGSFILVIGAIGYDVYLYTYAKDLISKEVIMSVSTSTDNVSDIAKLNSYTSTGQMAGLFEIYEKREAVYNETITALSASYAKNTQTGTSTRIASSTIATSSKQ